MAKSGNKTQAVIHPVTEINTGILAAGIAPAFLDPGGEFALVRLFGDDVNYAADGIAAIQRGKRARHDFNTGNVLDKRNPPVHFSGAGILNRLAVEQDKRFGLIDAAQRHAARSYGALRLAERATAQIETGHLI